MKIPHRVLLLHQYGLYHLVYKETGNFRKCSFYAEFVAMKQAMEGSQGFRYKLRMMGVPIEGPTHMYGDDVSTIEFIMLLERQWQWESC